MSRIEQALRRAAGEPPPPPTTGSSGADTQTTVRVVDYAAETAIGVEPQPPDPSGGLVPPTPTAPTGAAHGLEFAHGAHESRLITDPSTDPVSIEQYRRLATSLHHAQLEHGTKVLMVTSAMPHEGKTLTSTNLALALSESYERRVILIDTDLRRPVIHEVFNIPNATGLADGLASQGASLPIVEVTPRLTVLPGGRPDPDPTASLASQRMAAVLKEASARFDWVILDSPPVVLTSDTNIMAGLVDGIILVIGAGATAYQLVQRSIAELGRERIIGVVLNKIESSALSSEYYEHHHYERHYGRRTSGVLPA